MCILLYVTLIWCSDVPEMYACLLGPNMREREREEGRERERERREMGICVFSIHETHLGSGVTWIYDCLTRGVHLPGVYMCILLYVKLIRCNGVAYIYA